MTKGRLEAFSDGVFAIAITLLVLDIKVPSPERESGTLLRAIGDDWPHFAAYAVSFLIIGIIWVNHHAALAAFARVDRYLLLGNLGLLLWVTLLPWPTALLAEYLADGGQDSHQAAAVYGLVMTLMSASFASLWIIAARRGLLVEALQGPARRGVYLRSWVPTGVYAATIALAWVSAPLLLGVHALIALYYALEGPAERAL